MMKLQYLTCCLLSLSAVGCSQHFVQSPQKSEQIQTHTVHAVNAIYENSGFDFQGNMTFDVQGHGGIKNKNPELNQELKNKVNQYLNLQKINLSAEQRQQLQHALLQEQVENGEQKWSRLLTTGFNFLQDFQVKYQGGVDYRDQIGAMNITAAYHTPTLQMQLSYPMAVDLKQAKFYSNGFALFPFLTSAEQRDQLMYLDFSEYKKQMDQLDLRTLVAYIKQGNALPYVLATPQQLSYVNVTAADRQQGIVEKVQLKTSLEEYVAQTLSYANINKTYLKQHMKKAEAAPSAANRKDMTHQQQVDWAYALLQDKLFENKHLDDAQPELEADDEDVDIYDDTPAEVNPELAEDDADAEEEAVDAEEDAEQHAPELSKAQCLELQNQVKKASVGQYQACLDEDVDLFATKTKNNDQQLEKQLTEKSKGIFQVAELFNDQSNPKFKTAEDFQPLWQAKQEQIQTMLVQPAERSPLMIEIGIDRQGRAITTHYQLEFTADSIGKKLVVRSDNQWSNYGHPKNIDREAMRKAKTFAEAAKGTVLEDKVQKFKRLFGHADWDAQIQELANQSYAQNHSYLQTYQLVYGLLLSLNYPQIMQHYSAQDIQEIALVMAYYDGRDDQSFNPKGQQLKHIKQLIQKHQLNSSMFYKADAVSIVKKAQTQANANTQWAAIQKASKSPATRFARLYEMNYLDEYQEDKNPDLTHLANRLGEFYVESRKELPNFKAVEQISAAEYEYFDEDIFKAVYLQLLNSSNTP